MQNYVTGFEPYNELLCKLRIKGKYNNITLINEYVPTEDHTDETKEQFYDNLQYLLDKTPKSDIIIMYMFFWVFPRRQIEVGRRFGTLCQFHLQRLGEVFTQPLKMELTQGSETSANYNLTPGKYPKEHIQHCISCISLVI